MDELHKTTCTAYRICDGHTLINTDLYAKLLKKAVQKRGRSHKAKGTRSLSIDLPLEVYTLFEALRALSGETQRDFITRLVMGEKKRREKLERRRYNG